MTVLLFHDGRDEVLTSAWTARARPSGTEIAFVWGVSQIGWFDGATSVYRTTIPIPFSEFADKVYQGGTVDLRTVGKGRET